MNWFKKQTFDKLNEEAIVRLDEVIDSPSDRAQYQCVEGLPERYITEELFLSLQSIFDPEFTIQERQSAVQIKFQENLNNLSSPSDYIVDGIRRPEFEHTNYQMPAKTSKGFGDYIRNNYAHGAIDPNILGKVVTYEIHTKIQNHEHPTCLVKDHYEMLADILTNAFSGTDVLQMSEHIIDLPWYDHYTNIWGTLDEHALTGFTGPVWEKVKKDKNLSDISGYSHRSVNVSDFTLD
tara:strand:+ start:2482 stop:3189 length:708 start_codon:yes stop_codon:yes gene_type:complete